MGQPMRETQRTLRSGFLASCERYPDRPALHVADRHWSYAELRARAEAFAATLEAAGADDGPPLTAVFGHRSATAFAGLLAGLLRGHGYVPLNPAFPIDRTRTMLERSECRAVIVAPDAAGELSGLLEGLTGSRVFLLPDEDDATRLAGLAARHPAHRFLGAADLASDGFEAKPADPDGIAYLLFTSGSTGVPKGVMVAHRNVTHFIDAMVERYDVSCEARFSQLVGLLAVQHAEGGAGLEAERLHAAHHVEHPVELLAVTHVAPRGAHAESSGTRGLRPSRTLDHLVDGQLLRGLDVGLVSHRLGTVAAVLRAAARLDRE